jgi:hypothetical protein
VKVIRATERPLDNGHGIDEDALQVLADELGGTRCGACFDPRRAGNHVHLGEVGLPAQGFPIEGVASLKRLHTRSEANRPEVEETL